MLGRDHDRVDVMRFAVDVAHGNLRFRIGPQPRQPAVAAELGLALHEAMRQVDGHRHELRGLVACEAVHEALVAGALLEIHPRAFVDALLDVLRLLVESGEHRARAVVETHRGVVVTDALDHVPREVRVIHAGVRRDLTGHHDEPRGDHRFGGNAAMLVLREHRVEHCVGDGVGYFVRVSFGD